MTGDEAATMRQRQWISDLGVEPVPDDLTRAEASKWIEELRAYNDSATRGTIPEGRIRTDLFKVPPGRGPAAPPAAPSPTVTHETGTPVPGSSLQTVSTVDGKTVSTTTPLASEGHMTVTPEFQTGLDLQRSQRAERGVRTVEADAVVSAPVPSYLVLPEVGIEQAKRIWNAYLEFKGVILGDEACYDVIEGSREMNRTGATRLAMPFGLSIEQREIEEGRVELADNGGWDYRYRVRVRVSKGDRFVDGIGSSRISEIAQFTRERGKPGEADFRPKKEVPIGQREHFALTKAWTRGAKRAIADILGGTEAE